MATEVVVGHNLPDVSIDKDGEIVLVDRVASYQPWRHSSSRGKVRVIHYLAATYQAGKHNRRFFSELAGNDFDSAKFLLIGVLNISDALKGSASIIKRELIWRKRKNLKASIVVDSDGVGSSIWRLKKSSSAVIIIDGNGKVIYFKEAMLNDIEIEKVIGIVNRHLKLFELSNSGK